VGDGRLTVEQLIRKQSRRRSAATGGESEIPIDEETRRTLRAEGLELGDVLERDRELVVRKTANLHSGGTIHDVTPRLHPGLAAASVQAARLLDVPVVGLDLLVRDPAEPEYYLIEANERPGLANHEPQPTAERFVGLLFPASEPSEPRSAALR
jgi:D-alanine-D-alanine ligase-like ATP-grasp enzyme